MPDIALGVIVLNRVEKLRGLLESAIDKDIETVYIADNGHPSKEKDGLYTESYPFEITVLDLEYDIGLGRCRNEIVGEMEEEYLLMADSDHQVSNNIGILLAILQEKPSVGGVAGSIIEPSRERIWQSAKDFRLLDKILVKGNNLESKEIEVIDGYPFIEFDFIPYPTLYRTACLREYAWDPNIKINFAHDDFYVQHWMNTDWKFGVTPEVCFRHYPGGDSDYSMTKQAPDKKQYSEEYFLDKWNLKDFRTDGGYWYDTRYRTRTKPILERIIQTYSNYGVRGLIEGGIAKTKYEVKKRTQ